LGCSTQPLEEGTIVQELTRLDFVKSSAGAAAGMTVFGALIAAQADAEEGHHHGPKPVLAYIRNPKKGEITVMSGTREVVVHDRKLSAAITRALR
jgi:hypothetical protein